MSFLTLAGFAQLIRPLSTRVANMVSRGVVKRVDDAKKVQELQVELLADETRDGVERLQPYGLTSVPEADAECVVIFVGGRRDHGFALAVDDRRYRPTGLQPGDVCLYGKTGSKVVMKANGDVEVTPSTGVLKLNGTLEATGDVKAGAVSLLNHTHSAGTPPSGLSVTTSDGTFPVTGSTGGPS